MRFNYCRVRFLLISNASCLQAMPVDISRASQNPRQGVPIQTDPDRLKPLLTRPPVPLKGQINTARIDISIRSINWSCGWNRGSKKLLVFQMFENVIFSPCAYSRCFQNIEIPENSQFPYKGGQAASNSQSIKTWESCKMIFASGYACNPRRSLTRVWRLSTWVSNSYI